MARGWESKSVEEQMAQTPVEANHERSDEQRKAAAQDQAAKARRKQLLEMQREHILTQRTSNAHRRAALAAALEQVEAQIAGLN